jgi:putative ABC transport system permease protein
MTRLDQTALIQKESLSRHRYYFQILDDRQRDQVLSRLAPEAAKHDWRVTTVQERERSLGNRVSNAAQFLQWASLIALLLGGIGVASIVFTYARDKRPIAATLRCLGAPAGHTLGIYAAQSAAMGAIGTLIGTALGVGLQAGFPYLVGSAVAIDVPFFLSWRSILSGAVMGFGVTLLFAILPLLGLRSVPPIEALRVTGGSHPAWKDRLVWLAVTLLLALIFVYGRSVSRNLLTAAMIPTLLVVAFALIALVTRALLLSVRRFTPITWPYAWRHGLANLFRPQNQTYVLVPALGLGAALIFFVSFLNTSLLRHIAVSTGDDEPSLALVDIQNHQRDPLRELLARSHTPIIEETPFIAMRIETINDRPIEDLVTDTTRKRAEWALRHEYKSSYRNRLGPSEQIVRGQWPPGAFDSAGAIPISMEEGVAKDIGVGLSDKLTFNVQGMMLSTVISALRKVDWFQLRPNFFVIFPNGVLEEAPQFFVMLVRPGSVAASADLQRRVRAAFPNVSAVDLHQVLDTLKNYFGKISLALQAMSLFVMVTGLLILAAALISTRHERVKDAALLRIIGASRRDIQRIHLIEYALIGAFAGLMGIVVGAGSAWLATHFLFDIGFYSSPVMVLGGWCFLVALTVAAGLALGRDVLARPPLQTIRDEET